MYIWLVKTLLKLCMYYNINILWSKFLASFCSIAVHMDIGSEISAMKKYLYHKVRTFSSNLDV